MDSLEVWAGNVNPNHHQRGVDSTPLHRALQVIAQDYRISEHEKLRACGQVTDFNSHYSDRLMPVLGAEVTHDVRIPGSDYLFHFRTDLETQAEWDKDQVVVWDYKTVNYYQFSKRQEMLAGWSHSAQVNYYCWALKIPFLRMCFLVKPTSTTGRGGKPLPQFAEEVTEEMSKGLWTFTADVYPASCPHEVELELLRHAQRCDQLRHFPSLAMKNRNNCKGCGFFEVCADSDSYLEDDGLFTDKVPAHEGGKYLSVSQLYVLNQCEKKWKHSYIDLKSPSNWKIPALAYGAVVHDALEAWAIATKEEQQQ